MASEDDLLTYHKLVGLTDEEFLVHLGSELRPTDFGAGQPSLDDLIRRARVWQEDELPNIARKLCDSPRVSAFRSGSKQDKQALFVVIIDLLGSSHVGVPIATIAVLVVRMGLDKFCDKFAPTSKSR